MKKSTKRILCSVLSFAMASTLIAEQLFRASAEDVGGKEYASSTVVSTKFEDVTGKFDTSALRMENFNSTVQTEQKVAPTYETRTVMVTLEGDNLIDKAKDQALSSYLQTFEGGYFARQIYAKQNAFLQQLKKNNIPYTLERRFDSVLNAVAITVNTKYVSKIKSINGVKSAVITTTYTQPKTVDSGEVTNITSVYDTGIYNSNDFTVGYGSSNTGADYGSGSVVAILDTGLDYTHVAFQTPPTNPAWDEQHVAKLLTDCSLAAETKSGYLTASDVYVSAKVPFAYDYADNDADVYPSYSNHGTHVAGIIGGYSEEGYTDKDGHLVVENKDGIDVPVAFRGVVPNAQLVICKVFTDNLDDEDLGGAEAEDICAALEDCVDIGVDVINMSLGSSCGFTTTNDGDDEGEMLNEVYSSIQDAGISLVCAASNDYSSGYGGAYGTNLTENPDSSTVGSPSTFSSALSVASINGQNAPYMFQDKNNDGALNLGETVAYYEDSRDENGKAYDFVEQLLGAQESAVFEYVVIPNYGKSSDYTARIKSLVKGKIALISRGSNTFLEKVKTAMEVGAKAVIVYNNVAGVIRMNLGEIEDPIPAVSIDMDAGYALRDTTGDGRLTSADYNTLGKITVSKSTGAGPFMSEFSSWGPTHDLKIKPEITAHGGEITSTVPGGYGEQSGTSMASPNMAGVMAILRSYVKSNANLNGGSLSPQEITRLANQLIMSTATIANDQGGHPYSPRKQGAGLGSLTNAIKKTSAYLWVDNQANDYRPKLELGDDDNKEGIYTMTFKLTNFGTSTLTFDQNQMVFTETVAKDKLSVAEKSYALDPDLCEWKVDGTALTQDDKITVAGQSTVEINVKITLSKADKDYIDASFKNGMYVEGFLQLVSNSVDQCNLNLPFLAFYGDWEQAPMLDYTAYEIAQSQQEDLEEEQIKARVWGTQPFASYYNEKYILPMGGYVYLLDDDDKPMYAKEEYCAVSRYNENQSENEAKWYMTSTSIKAVYAGLLRNARIVTYTLTDVTTGEVLLERECNRVSKAYAGGGSAVPANVELELDPEIEGLVANGQYKMDFVFYMNDPTTHTVFEEVRDSQGNILTEQNNIKGEYAFTFTVDYDAPIVEDVRVKYDDYKEGNKEKQRIYLEIDVFDNHYAQAIMLCYPKKDAQGDVVLQLATDYPTPVRNPNKNGTTTVSIEVTDYFDYIDKSGKEFYIQVDDYAINSSLYKVDISKAHQSILPVDGFDLADGEENITLGLYETHKVNLVYDGNANLSNFEWSSGNASIANVRNGEIVGLKAGTTTITVADQNNRSKTINVTVTDNSTATLVNIPTITFDTIKDTFNEALKKADGELKVSAGKTFKLEIEKDPWYHPMTGLTLAWSSTNPTVATVDANGQVKTLKKGMTSIFATVVQNGVANVSYTAKVTLNVQQEFNVSNYTLTRYQGIGYNGEICNACHKSYLYEDMVANTTSVKDSCPYCKAQKTAEKTILIIPADMNIMYIGEDAFKDNDNVQRIVIPSQTVEIRESAFENCTALKEVYFVNTKPRETLNDLGKVIAIDDTIDWADLSLMNQRAFYSCTALEKIDFSNAKTMTIAHECFANCTSLSEIIDLPSVGTAYHYAFAGCTSLESVDLTGMYVTGVGVFQNCTSLEEIQTDKFTSIGEAMFLGCTSLSSVELRTGDISDYAFKDCTYLSSVKLMPALDGYSVVYTIGARAFENCGSSLTKKYFTLNQNGQEIRSIGENAFLGARLNTVDNFLTKDVIYNNVDKTAILYVNPNVTTLDLSATQITEIPAYAFANSKLTSITLPSTLKTIGEGAFSGSLLKSIDLSATQITQIPAYAFANSKLETITLSNRVVKVGNLAFAYCTNLKEVEFADVNAVFGDMVFAYCTSLKKVALPSFVSNSETKTEALGSYTFYGASALKTVTFGVNSNTTGNYTFSNSGIEKVYASGSSESGVLLRQGQTTLEEGLFMNCRNLSQITLLDTVTQIDLGAFENCTFTDITLSNVESIGERAFYNVPLQTLDLEKVKTIGYGAFAVESEGRYTQLNMPLVEEIGGFAFYNNTLSSIEIPKKVHTIGGGAFASAKNLESVTVNSGNVNFFVDGNVLYRIIDNEKRTYELVFYPSALEGNQSYTAIDGTVRVHAHAFYNLNQDVLKKVTLPYSVKTIGDGAFLNSGITEYTFDSIQAPILETVYQESVVQQITNSNREDVTRFKGYYYSNFTLPIVEYSIYGNQTSLLQLKRPENGVGYDNYLYRLYFGNTSTTGVKMTDETRLCANLIDGFKTIQEVSAWLNVDASDAQAKAEVEAFASIVTEARNYYNNILKDEKQLELLGTQKSNALITMETEMRKVKKHFGIIVKLKSLTISPDSTHKTSYLVGERFTTSGLKLIATYEDGSTKLLDASMLQVISANEELGIYDNNEIVRYQEGGVAKTFTVKFSVTEKASNQQPDNSSNNGNDTNDTKNNGGIVILVIASVVVVGLGVGVFFFVKTKKVKKNDVVEENVKDKE